MIDWTRVEELVSEIGTDDFGEVVEIFLEEVDEAMGGLCSGGEPAEVQQTLHLVKGCAWNLGFVDLGATCARHEGTGDPLSDDALCGLQECYRSSRRAFMDGLVARSIRAPAA